MSTQPFKSTFSRALSLVPVSTLVKSDTVNIPYAGTNYKTSTVTTITSSKLIDSSVNFLTTGANALCVKVGDIVWNNTSGNAAYVTNVDSATQLSLSTNAFGTLSESYTLFSSGDLSFGNPIACYLYCATAGAVRITTAAGDVVTISGIVAGSIVPVQAIRLHTTSTTVTSVVALW